MNTRDLNSMLISIGDEIDSLVNSSELLNMGIDCCTYYSIENFNRFRLLVNCYLFKFESEIENVQKLLESLKQELNNQSQSEH